MNRFSYFGVVALTALLPAGAVTDHAFHEMRITSENPTPSLTIYTGNLALVRRTVERLLPAGSHTVRVESLPSNIDPSSLIVLNEEATLLGVHGFRSYQDAGGPGASLDLDLDIQKQVESLRLAFLTSGLNWSATYSVVVARDNASARVDGYATLVNGSGTGYEDAEVQLLAGTIQQGGRSQFADEFRMARSFEEGVSAPALERAAFGDYHLYTVSAPISLRAGESRRIRLVGAQPVKTGKEYTFSNALDYHRQYPEPLRRPVAVSYRLERSDRDEFGSVPLPGGQVRVLQRDEAGRVQLLGITAIGNTPKGADLRLDTGFAFDVVGTRTQTEFERVSSNVYESAWKVELKNESGSGVTVQVIEHLTGDWRIVESTHRHERLSAGAVRFLVDVPSEGEAQLEYRISVRT